MIPPRVVIVLIETFCLFYYSKEFIRLKVQMKYQIKCELVSAAASWVSLRIFMVI